MENICIRLYTDFTESLSQALRQVLFFLIPFCMIRLNAALLMASIKRAVFCVLLHAVGAAAGSAFEVGRFQNKSLPQVISRLRMLQEFRSHLPWHALSESLMAVG